MYRIRAHLLALPLQQLRPTQMTVGYREVQAKREDWSKLSPKERRKAMNQVLFPVVKGPNNTYFALDHHHMALALLHEKAECVQAGQVADLSGLSMDDLWIFLDHFSWVHAYDANGKRKPFKAMPQRFEDLQDDPYRSLASAVRDAGGFAKVQEPFLEFLWANHFREQISKKTVNEDFDRAVKKGIELASSKHAAHLPGWSGRR